MNFNKNQGFDPRKSKATGNSGSQNHKYFPVVDGKVLVTFTDNSEIKFPLRENLILLQCQRFSGDSSESREELKINWVPGNPVNQDFLAKTIFKETFSQEMENKRFLQILLLRTVEAYIKNVGEVSGYFRVYPDPKRIDWYFVYKAEFRNSQKEIGRGLENNFSSEINF